MRLTEEELPTHANLDCRRRSTGTTAVSSPSSIERKKNCRKITSRQSFVVGDGDNEDKDNCPGTPDGRASSKSEIIVLKPGKHSSQAPFRIQVTVHRPLSWQLSSSSSTYSLPQQIHQQRRHRHHHHHRLQRSGSSPNSNEKKHEHECQNEISKPLSMSPSEKSPRIMYTDVKRREGFLKNISIMNGKCDAEWRSPSRRRGRRMKRIQMSSTQVFSDQSSTADEEEQAGDGIYADEENRKEIPRLRKPLKKLTSSLSTESTALFIENEENHNPNLLRFHRHFSLKFPTEGEPRRQRQANRRRKGTQSLTAGRHEDETTGENAKTVMTWFRQARNPVHKKSGMGATGSTHGGGGGRLKSRSQSSSALYCIKSNNNGQLVGDGGGLGHHRQLHASTTADYHYRNSGSNPLSTSIPADLWDLAPTTKSFSPITRKHSRPHLQHQQSAEYPSETSATTTVESKNQKNKHRPFPFVDAFIHRASEKHAKKGKSRGGSGGSSSGGGGGREKFYAVSCPDVAQEANNSNSFRGSSFSSASQHRVNNSKDYGCSSGRSTAFDQYDSQQGDGRSSSCTTTTLGNSNQSGSFKPRSTSSSCRGHPSTHRHHPHCHNQHHHPHHHSHHRQQQQQHPLHHQQQQQQQQQQQYQQQFHPAAYYQNSGSQPIRYSGEEDYRQTPITFPFITEADIFEIRLIRDHRGLGLSVTGGSDSEESYPGLIRIKKVFPMSPAFQSGRLRPWDIILKANGVPLTGLTNHEALEVLRTTPVETILTVCRPPAFIPGFHILEQSNNSQSQPVLSQLHSPSYEDPYQEEQHRRQLEQQLEQQEQHQNNSANAFNPSVKSKSLSSLKIPTNTSGTHQSGQYGEFEVTLEKINGSLGFTLRQEDTSILGHYVRALVKDPALSDGRIQPGDRILSVNGYDLSGVSHADAIAFLRQCPPKVTLRLYRDISPTPVSPLSPTESHRSKKTKPLRQEAIDMLNDLALRKRMSGSESKSSLPSGSRPGLRSLSKQLSSQDDKGGSPSGTPPNGPATLPRRRHAPGVTPSPEVLSAALDRFAGRSATPKSAKSGSPESVKSSRNNLVVGNYPVEARSSGSGESTPRGTSTLQRANRAHHADQVDSSKKDSVSSESSLEGGGDGGGRMRRPSFRQYTLHLDRISSIEDESFSSDLNHTDSIVSEPGFGSSPKHESNFRHGQPAYQSAILPSTARPGLSKKTKRSKDDSDKCSAGRADSPATMSDIDAPSGNHQKMFASSKASQLHDSQQMTRQASEDSAGDVGSDSLGESNKPSTSKSTGSSGGLLKWKGVVFSQENTASDGDNGSGDKDRTGDDEDDDLESSATSTLSLRDTFPGCSSSNKRDQRKSRSDQSGDEDGDSHACYDNYDYDIDGDDDENTEPVDGTSIFPQRRSSPDGREFRDCDMTMEVTNSMTDCNGEQIFTVQLNRRWCSRLGFSLQGCDGHTFISAIYPDSVAAKDGRLRVGDEIIMVNNETIRDVDTAQVIDMMRKTRGVMNITILRKSNGTSQSDDNPNSAPLNPT